MSNFIDWESGVVNRNFFILQELILRPEIERVLLVDFLAIKSINKNFGRRRTYQYGRAIKKHQPVHTYGKHHRVVKLDHPILKTNGKDIYVFEGLGVAKSEQAVINHVEQALKDLLFDQSNLLLWSYNPLIPSVFDLPNKRSVFDAVDNWAKHPSYEKFAQAIEANYKEINQKAKQIFAVSNDLTKSFDSKKTTWVPNGVDTKRFDQTAVATTHIGTVIGYVGTIQDRLDFDLIAYLCEQHPDKKFRFIGPIWKDVRSQARKLDWKHKNIEFMGRQPYAAIPHLLGEIDLCIIPHRVDEFLKSMNPMKMYDYLAAGKPVVTTPGAGTEVFKDYLSIQETKETFSEAITQELKEDSATKRQARKTAVEEHQWGRRVETMVNLIN